MKTQPLSEAAQQIIKERLKYPKEKPLGKWIIGQKVKVNNKPFIIYDGYAEKDHIDLVLVTPDFKEIIHSVHEENINKHISLKEVITESASMAISKALNAWGEFHNIPDNVLNEVIVDIDYKMLDVMIEFAGDLAPELNHQQEDSLRSDLYKNRGLVEGKKNA